MANLTNKCFKCSSCGTNYDESPAVGACSICEDVQCHDCMSKEGVCVPCDSLRK